MASASRESHLAGLQFLCAFLGVFWVPRLSICTAIRSPGNFTETNPGCQNFITQESCITAVLPNAYDPNLLLSYQVAFLNRLATPDEYSLSIVWAAYPDSGPTYQWNVWSANRNRPVRVGASVTFVPNGSLALYDSDSSQVWSTQTDNKGAVGVDFNPISGELVLYGAQNETIWSSFSHPTDTILAGQQLVWQGVGQGMKLVSSNSSTNNSEGVYSLVMEPAGLVLYASLPDPQPYFVWNYFAQSEEAMPVSSLQSTCSGNPVTLDLSGNGQLALSNISVNSSSLSAKSQALCNLTANYNIIETNSYPSTSNAIFMTLESNGTLTVFVYSNITEGVTIDYDFFNTTKCDLPEMCGSYGVCKGNGLCECPSNSSFLPINSSFPGDGCYNELDDPLVTPCTIPANVKIDQVNYMDYYSNRFSAPSAINLSVTECSTLCVHNCSCTASFYDSESGACYSVSDYPLASMISTTNSNLTALVKISTALPGKRRSSITAAVAIGISAFSITLLVVVGFGAKLYRRKILARRSREDKFLETLPGLPPRYSKMDLDKATLGFTKKLGAGGFGTVYEGTLKDRSKIAVKRLDSSKSSKDFRAEMATLGSIHHINLVRLRGFCADGSDNMLVYEYMANGSLDRWLFSNHSEEPTELNSTYSLDWRTRFKIALGTARGLAYLHDECSERIIHLDIKPQNILLDKDFNPKVADFGLSKLVDRDLSAVVTTMRGTPGYLAPEWLLQSAITDRTDVYSYGIVLIEIVVGRKCLDSSKTDSKERYAPAWLLHLILQGSDTYALDVMDPKLNIDDSEVEQVTTALHIALECIQDEVTSRPSMEEVVQMLEGFRIVPDLPRESIAQKYRFLSLETSSKQLCADPSCRSNSSPSSSDLLELLPLQEGSEFFLPF